MVTVSFVEVSVDMSVDTVVSATVFAVSCVIGSPSVVSFGMKVTLWTQDSEIKEVIRIIHKQKPTLWKGCE
jgi:hypothetical protein